MAVVTLAAAVEVVAVVWRGGCAHTGRGSRVVMVAGHGGGDDGGGGGGGGGGDGGGGGE